MTATDLDHWMEDAGAKVRRRIRLLMLLDAADYAGNSPLSVSRLHAFAFLADVLSPLYNLTALSGRIMKRRIGPYFPDLQWELDRLIGQGLVDVSDLQPIVEVATAYLDARYSLNRPLALPLLEAAMEDAELLRLRDFFRQLAGALGAVPEEDLDAAAQADVTWDSGHSGAIIDYAEWRAQNYSKISAERIEEIAREQVSVRDLRLSPGTKVSLYVQYLRRAANA